MSDKPSYVLIGASGHAKVVLDILEKSGEKIDCLLELNPSTHQVLNYPVVNEERFFFESNHLIVVAIGDNKRRKMITSKLAVSYGLAKHPDATLSHHVNIGKGSMIMAKAVINPDVRIGMHCIINSASVIEHDTVIEDFCHISPGAVLCGGVLIGEGTQVGAGAVILPGIKIGNWATIGAGAIIRKDVADEQIVVGNPGRIIR